MKIHFRGKIYAEDFVSGVVPVVAVIIQSLNISGKFIRKHGVNFVFVAVLHGLFVIPAFEFQHIQGFFQLLHFFFHSFFSGFEHCLTVGVSGRTFLYPFEKLPDVLDLHASFFQTFNDPECIGIIGICGWGGMALNAAAIDTRIKATVTSTMYDMTRVTANGYFDADDNPDARYALRQALNAQRTADYKAGTYRRAGGVVDPVPEDAPFFVKDYHDYYKTPRGYHPRSLNSTGGWNVTSPLSLLNAKLLAYAGEIRSAVLMIHGDKAHSCYFSRDAFAKLQGDNKELLLIPGAVHTDLYDRMDIIPFDRIEAFYHQYLK